MFLNAFKGYSRELQGYLKEVQWAFQGSFKAVSKMLEVSRDFKESVRCVSRKLFYTLVFFRQNRSSSPNFRACREVW